ncbi:hypothetical protein ACFX2A_034139 [Malus domestica]
MCWGAFDTWDGTGRDGTERDVPSSVWYAKNGWNALFHGTEIGCFYVPPPPGTGCSILLRHHKPSNPNDLLPKRSLLPSNPNEFELDFGLSGLNRRRICRNTGETDRNVVDKLVLKINWE